MNERIKTAAFAASALALAIAAAVVQPERRTAAILSDQGEAFYPQFRDPQAVKSIEVVDYDEPTATARPLKVESRKGRWVIASNNDYPVDAGDRLVKTSAALMDLRKDQVRSDSVQDHARYGVIDPLDQGVSSLQGRGKRVTLRDAGKLVLADFIFGRPVENKPGWRYVRVPGQKRTYAVKTDADPSARFSDWVNAGLVRIPSASIRRVTMLKFFMNMGRLESVEQVTLTHENGQWKSAGGEAVKEPAAKALAAALENLKIADARPKPPELAQNLRANRLELTMATMMSLQQRGFFVTPAGRLIASEGELAVETANGTAYQLRFGDVAGGGDNRYLFVTATWDAARAAKYGDTSGAGEKSARDLTARFADWFYTVNAGDVKKLLPGKKEILR